MNFDFFIIMRNNICNIIFTPIKYLILLETKSYFSPPNDTKYLAPSKTLTNISTLSNLIHSGFVPKYCVKCHKPRYFYMVFHLLKYYQDQNLQF